MLMIANCMFPVHQTTLLWHWMVYSGAWPPSSHRCRRIKTDRTQLKVNPSYPERMTATKIPLYVSHWASRCQNQPSKICSDSEGNNWQKLHLPLTYISSAQLKLWPYVAHMRRIHHYLDLDSAKLLATGRVPSHLDYCNSLCMVVRTLISPNFNVFRIDWPAWWQSYLHLLSAFHCFVLLHWLPVRFTILFKSSLLKWKTLCKIQPVYLHFKLATSLPFGSLRSNKWK